MNEDRATAIVELIDIIATKRALQKLWESAGDASETARYAEEAREAIQLLKESLMIKDDGHE